MLICTIAACKKEKQQNIFYTYFQSDPGRIDPFFSTDVLSGKILSKICSGLFKINAKGDLEKDLLQEYDFSGTKLTCVLKDSIFFSNGDPVSSRDVQFSLYRIRNSQKPTSPRRWIFQKIKHITIVNNKKFIISLNGPYATFLYQLTLPCGYIISQKAYQTNQSIIGSGPFYLKEWRRDEHLLLVQNPYHGEPAPNIEGMLYTIIPEDLTARFEFLNNTLDYFEIPYLSRQAFNRENITYMNVPEYSVYYIAINNTRYPFNNRQFRYSLNMAVNRKELMKILFKDRFTLASGPVPTGIGGYNQRVEPIPYAPGKAAAYFATFPEKDRHFTINIKADHQVALIAQLLQYYLEKAGLQVQIREMEWAALKATTIKADYQLALFTWQADYPEAENFLTPLFHSKNQGAGGNRAFYANPRVDLLLKKSQSITNNRKRFDIYNQIERLIIHDAPWIFLWYGDKRIALSKRVTRFVPYPTYNGMKGLDITLNE